MPTFETPEPIEATIDVVVGDVRVTASDRQQTVVDVRPSDASHEPDVHAAEQTRVEYTATGLLIRSPRQRTLGARRIGSVDVAVELPLGSTLHADTAAGAIRATGRLGECRIKVAAGGIDLDEAGPADLSTSAGGIAVDRVTGHAEISTSSGRIRVREIDGSAVIKNSNGECFVGEITGDLRVNAANGTIVIGEAGADVTATTANGDVRVGAITRGVSSLKTGYGQIEIGIRSGTAARLDAHTGFGQVRNSMQASDGPGPDEETAEVRARTSFGDIVIRRSGSDAS
jgi:Putative adhesin